MQITLNFLKEILAELESELTETLKLDPTAPKVMRLEGAIDQTKHLISLAESD